MKLGNVEVTLEEFETARKVISALANEVMDRMENEIGTCIKARSTFYAGFSGGVLGACDLETSKRFAEVISKVPLGGQ